MKVTWIKVQREKERWDDTYYECPVVFIISLPNKFGRGARYFGREMKVDLDKSKWRKKGVFIIFTPNKLRWWGRGHLEGQ